MDPTARIETEIEGAKEAFEHLLEQNIKNTSKFDNGEKFSMSFKLNFHRLARRTEVKGSVSYSQTLKDVVEIHCRDPLQMEIEMVTRRAADG